MATQRSTTVGVFDDRTQAERAVETLHNAGIPADQIRYSNNMGTGGGFLASIKNLFSGLERSAEAIVNDLMGMGLTQEEARYYAHHYEMGHTIVAVQSSGNMPDALSILRSCGAHDYHTQAGMGGRGVTSGVTQQSNDARTAPIRMGDTTAPSSGQGFSMGTGNTTAGQGSSMGAGNTMQRPSGQNMATQGDASFTGDNRQNPYNQGQAAQRETSTSDTAQPSYNQTSGQTGGAYGQGRDTQPSYNRSADDTSPRGTMGTDQTHTPEWRDTPQGDPTSQRAADWGAQARPGMERQEASEQPMYGDPNIKRSTDPNQRGDPGMYGDSGQDLQKDSGMRKDVNPDARRERDRHRENDQDVRGDLGMPDENDPDRRGMFDRGV